MKTLSMLALLMTSPAYAQETDPVSSAVLCPQFGEIARAYMTQRQNGAPLDLMMATVDMVDTSAVPFLNSLTKKIVLGAYEHPRYSTPHIIENTIQDYANTTMLQCFQQMGID